MAESFSYAENQGAIEVNFSQMTTGEIYIEDEDGNVLAKTTTEKSFNSVVVSCPGIEEGETYTVYAGGQSETVTMDSLLYGSSSMMGGGMMGGGMQGGGMQGGEMQGGEMRKGGRGGKSDEDTTGDENADESDGKNGTPESTPDSSTL
jgi:hypothetical protein